MSYSSLATCFNQNLQPLDGKFEKLTVERANQLRHRGSGCGRFGAQQFNHSLTMSICVD
jgi:hypothetical protein